MVLTEVQAEGAAERTGLRIGDRIVSVDGQSVRNVVDWMGIRANFEVGVLHQLEIERDPGRLRLTLALWQQQPFKNWDTSSQQRSLAFRGSQMFLLLLGLFIAFSKPYDVVARIGAWFLAALSTFQPAPPVGLAALWRHLPSPIGAFLWIGAFSSFLGSPLLFTFFLLFPRKAFSGRWIWIVAWAPMSLVIPPCLAFWYHVVYRPQHVTGIVPAWCLVVVVLIAFAYINAGLVALVLNYRRLTDLNQRRRVRVLVAGSMIGILPVTLKATFGFLPALQHTVGLSESLDYFTIALTPVFPLSFAYAILRHQLFDVRLIIRSGLQYAVARGVLLYLVPAAVVALVFDLLLHKDQTLGVLLSQRGWLYGVVIGLAFLTHLKRQNWMEALDRRFFREHYDAHRLLREVAEEIREARSFGQVAPRVVTHIETALHPEFVDLLSREPHEPDFKILAAAPPEHALPAFPAENKLVALVRLLRKPIEVPQTATGWLKEQLPPTEMAFLQRTRVELFVPIATSVDRPEAVLALGPKRSEEPYSREDLDLLVAITTSLAMLLEKPLVAGRARTDVFDECPQCGACYEHGAVQCSRDKARLVPMILPRLLAGRYHLEQRLGRGGMGIVYAASDSTLERRVAVKVIREELVGSAEAAERFRREARVAANFTHPNVVTVYDFGVAGPRAFLVMELLEGRSLREALRGHNRFLPARALPLLQDVCTALEAAHLQRLVHRDLKPENIFLVARQSGETAKLLDFGLAKFLPVPTDQLTTDTAPGVVLGTPRYMSPEQRRGGEARPAWDLWALAIVAYEMLTGAYPFDLESSANWLGAGPVARFSPVAAHLPEAPRLWQGFFEHSFAPDPAERPQSVQMLFSELQSALS